MRRILRSLWGVGVLLALVATVAYAAPIVITNPGFETPVVFTNSYSLDGTTQLWTPAVSPSTQIPGWTVSASTAKPSDPGGVWAPQYDTVQGLFITPYAGTNVGYSNGGTLSQTLSAVMQDNAYYTLSVAIGRRAEAYMVQGHTIVPQNYTIGLYSGSQLVFQVSGNTGSQFAGTWNVVSFQIYTGLGVTPGAIKIALGAGGPQVDFDNVSLDYSPVVPEPATYVLMGSSLLLLGWWFQRRRKSA